MSAILSILNLVLAIVVVASSHWVYRDSKKYIGIDYLNPWTWSACVLFMWILAFPTYLILKFGRYNRLLKAGLRPITPEASLKYIKRVRLIFFIIIAGIFLYFSIQPDNVKPDQGGSQSVTIRGWLSRNSSDWFINDHDRVYSGPSSDLASKLVWPSDDRTTRLLFDGNSLCYDWVMPSPGKVELPCPSIDNNHIGTASDGYSAERVRIMGFYNGTDFQVTSFELVDGLPLGA